MRTTTTSLPVRAFAVACAALMMLSGCASVDSGSGSKTAAADQATGKKAKAGGKKEESAKETTTTTPKPLPPVASIPDGTKDIPVHQPVTVKAVQGRLTDVVMTNQDGKVVASHISEDGTSWTTDEVLGYYRDYTIVAKAANGTQLTTHFSTARPQATTGVALAPLNNSVVGIGQVIGFYYDTNVPDRLAAQKSIEVITDPPVEGAFYWLNGRMLRWRPENFWQPGTKVTVTVHNYGTDLGDGLFGGDDNQMSFTIGEPLIATADDATKTVTVEKNGQVINTFPTSMGMDSMPTPNGVYVIGSQQKTIVMDSSTFGLPIDAPNGYRSNVNWATQMSWSGIYLHAAPWSLWAQGKQNVSHGCLNVSTENARWFMENSKRGDVIIVKNTKGPILNGMDGLGDWNIDWATWKAGNA